MAIAIDTLDYARRLRQAGFSEEQATGQAQALAAAMTDSLATKQDLRELEARLDARFVGIDGRFVGIDGRFAQVDMRFDALEKRFDAFEKRFDERFDEQEKRFDGRFDEQEKRFTIRLDELEKRITIRFDEQDRRFGEQEKRYDAKLSAGLAGLRTDMATLQAHMTRMMIGGVVIISALVKLT